MSKIELFKEYKIFINNLIDIQEDIINNHRICNVRIGNTIKQLKEESSKYLSALKAEDGREAQERKEQQARKKQELEQKRLLKPPKPQKGGNTELLEKLKQQEEEIKRLKTQLEDSANTPTDQKIGSLKTQNYTLPPVSQKGGNLNNPYKLGIPVIHESQKQQDNAYYELSTDTFMKKNYKIANQKVIQ